MKTLLHGVGVGLTALWLSACGGGGGGAAGPTCTINDIPAEPDVVGQPVIHANAVSPGDTVAVSIPIDADTRFVRAFLVGGGPAAANSYLNIGTPANQTVTLNIQVGNILPADDYPIVIAVCSDADACDSRGTGIGVSYAVNLTGDTNLSRKVFWNGTGAGASTASCLTAQSINVAPGNTPNLVGELDPGFNSTGMVRVDQGGNEYAAGTVVQLDGKVVVLGDDGADLLLMRLNTNGSMDSSFGVNGIARIDIDGGNDVAADIALDSHGRILVAGRGLVSGIPRTFVMRVLANGSRDTSFGSAGLALTPITTLFTIVNAIALDHAERIVVGGSILNGGGETDLFLARFLADGTVDTDFNLGLGYKIRDIDFPSLNASWEEILDIAIVAGYAIFYGGAANVDTAALSTADYILGGYAPGSLTVLCTTTDPCDHLYAYTPVVVDSLFGVTVDNANRILATGMSNGAITLGSAIGSIILDPSFTPSSTVITGLDHGSDVLSLPDNKILVGGSTMSQWVGRGIYRSLPYSGDFALLRYTSSGAYDTSFGSGGTGIVVSDVTGQPEQLVRLARRGGDGTVIAVGNTNNGTNSDILITRYR